MSKYLELTVLLILIFGLASCNIRTPEINGVVLDAETKQPVKEAWVRATIDLYSKTFAGNVHRSFSIDKPHTRTDKDGRFVIPSRTLKKSSFPTELGTEVVNLGIGASRVDDRGGRINIKGERLKELLGKKNVELTIYIKPFERTEDEYFYHLQSLYTYCLTGRSSTEVPSVEGGCDEWELNYAIAKHERYLEKYKDPKIVEKPPYGISKWDEIIRYSNALSSLAHLYKRKGDYKKSLDTFNRVVEFDKKHGLSFHSEEHELEIKGLQQKLKGAEK
jgi:tetratricopeptide (TPR) repeat protein